MKSKFSTPCTSRPNALLTAAGCALVLTLALLPGLARAQTPPSATAQGGAGATAQAETNASARTPSKLMEIGVEAALERARSFYQAGRYDSCAKSYGEILQLEEEVPKEIAPPAVEQAREYYAACLLAIGETAAADDQLRQALTANPLMASPDPVVFPDQVRDLFFKVKADFLDDIQRAQEAKLDQARLEAEKRAELVRQEQLRVERLEQLASTETLIHQNRRWLAWVPFGVGQFQNGSDVFGTVMLTSQVLALGTAVFSVSRELSLHSQADGGTNVEQAEAFNEPIQLLRPAGVYAGASFLFLVTIGILEAHINFVPESPAGTRSRPLPASVRQPNPLNLDPQVSVGPQGASLGFSARF